MVVNAAHGFLNMLARLVADRDPDLLVCAQDVHWRPQWRVDLIASYKTQRIEMDPVPQLDAQMPVIFDLLDRLNVPVAGAADYEAEDVIGALIPRLSGQIEIVSGDRDLFQLVRDPQVCVLYPKRGVTEMTRVTEKYIEEKYGIPGRAYADFAILRGDTSDGLPGVPGIGEKTAAALVRKYGSLPAIIEAAMTGNGTGALGKVLGNLDYLDRAAQIVFISDEAPIGEVDMTRPRSGFDPAVRSRAERYGLGNAVDRLVTALTK
jgi:5'-3' exonuclease